jgi:hypothetical protein
MPQNRELSRRLPAAVAVAALSPLPLPLISQAQEQAPAAPAAVSGGRGTFGYTSFVVDPPNGQIPPVTPAAAARRKANANHGRHRASVGCKAIS